MHEHAEAAKFARDLVQHDRERRDYPDGRSGEERSGDDASVGGIMQCVPNEIEGNDGMVLRALLSGGRAVKHLLEQPEPDKAADDAGGNDEGLGVTGERLGDELE